MHARSLGMAVAALCMIIALTGCADGRENHVTVNKPAAESAQESVELTFFAPIDVSSSAARSYSTIIDHFNEEHPNVHVTLDGVATGDGFNQFLEERLDAGEGDDVFIVNADTVKSLYSKGYFYDMKEFPSFARLNDAARAQSTIGDIAYCLPLSMNAYSMAVNLDVLEQEHLAVPTNLEEFEHCCEVLKVAGVTPIALNRWYALTVPAMATGLMDVYGHDNAEAQVAALNDGSLKVGDVMADGFSLVESMIDRGWYGDGLTSEAVDAMKAGDKDVPDFANGNAAFMFAPAQSYERILAENPDARFVITGVPVSGGMVTLPAVGVRLCINAAGDNVELAQEFVEYLTSEEMKAEQSGRQGFLPVFRDQEVTLDASMDPMLEVYRHGVQIPIEDMNLCFTYWDTVRELCIQMFDGYSADQAVRDYNAIQAAAVAEE